MIFRVALLSLLAAPAAAQFGARNAKPAGSSDVDLAMAGWEQLSQNPDKMQEVMAAMKDPEVMAKAQEMLKDPHYMAAAKAKVNELQAKAQQRGLLDANGEPVPGAHKGMGGGSDLLAGLMGGGAAGGAAAGGAAAAMGQAREWEMDNAARHRSGELNDAELGIANLKQAMGDPNMMKGIADMMRDPNTMAEVQKMMADPAFKAQAAQVAQSMGGAGGMDFSKMGEMMAGMGGGMGGRGGGMGGIGGGMMGGAAGGVEAEMAKLRAENALLKGRMGMRDEL